MTGVDSRFAAATEEETLQMLTFLECVVTKKKILQVLAFLECVVLSEFVYAKTLILISLGDEWRLEITSISEKNC